MPWRRLGPLVLIFIAALSSRGALAARVDCGVLLKGAAEAGVTPTLYLDPVYGIARLESGGDHCVEPIEEWRVRGLPLKSSGKAPRPAPEAAESPAQAPADPPEAAKETPAQAPAGPPEAVKDTPAPTPRPRETAEPCDRAIDEFWQGTVVAVGNVSYSLVRVYTIDLNSDNRVDDVGFRLKARRKPDLVISYFRGNPPPAPCPSSRFPTRTSSNACASETWP